MGEAIEGITVFTFAWGWVFGVAAAKGFVSTAVAVCIPPYAWVVFAGWMLERWTQ